MSSCTACGDALVKVRNRKIILEVGNPIQVPVEASFEECQRCGKRLFDADESLRLENIIAKALKDANSVKVKVGKRIEIEN